MKVLISGGTGFIGRWLAASLLGDGHQVWALSRDPEQKSAVAGFEVVEWDGSTPEGWGHMVNEMDAIVNLAGRSLDSWPWTKALKLEFLESRLNAGRAITEAIRAADHKPAVLLQASGINHYGLEGELADESTPPGDDYLARLTVDWEDSTRAMKALGVRRVVTRSAVALAPDEGLLPLMSLPVKLFVGGRLAEGTQSMPWIHIADVVGAMRYLLENEQARGAFNLISPQPTSSDLFMRGLAKALKRPYWFPKPAFLLRLILGEMSVMVTHGRYSQPKRLTELGYEFKFPTLESALADIYS